MPRAIIFDFDGVIADTEWLHSETFRRVLAEEGIFLTDKDHGERFLGINDLAAFAKAYTEVGRAPSSEEVLSLVARKSAFFTGRLGEIGPFPGVADLIAALAERCPLAIGSGGRGAEIDAVLRAHELRDHFLAVLSSDEVPRSKPAPDLFLAALDGLRKAAPERTRRIEPAHCLVIEDSIQGIRAAKAAGMTCIAVAHTYPVEKLTEADIVVGSIGELSAAELLAGDF